VGAFITRRLRYIEVFTKNMVGSQVKNDLYRIGGILVIEYCKWKSYKKRRDEN